MFESIINFFKNLMKKENKTKDTARERLQLVLMQDRASVSADYLDLMKQEIIEVIKKYINIDENALQVELTKPKNKDGTYGAPSLYANIPILSIKTEHKVKEEKKSNLVDVEQEKNKIDNNDKRQDNKNQNVTNQQESKDKNTTKNQDESKSGKEATIKNQKEDASKSESPKKNEEKSNDSSKNPKQSNNKQNSDNKNVSNNKKV